MRIRALHVFGPLLLVAAQAGAVEQDTLLGFSPTEMTMNELLADGYEVKTSNVGLAFIVILQKGESVAFCALGRDRHDCLLSLDSSAAKSKVRAGKDTAKAKAAGQPFNRPSW